MFKKGGKPLAEKLALKPLVQELPLRLAQELTMRLARKLTMLLVPR